MKAKSSNMILSNNNFSVNRIFRNNNKYNNSNNNLFNLQSSLCILFKIWLKIIIKIRSFSIKISITIFKIIKIIILIIIMYPNFSSSKIIL